jgi:hypothetical protein
MPEFARELEDLLAADEEATGWKLAETVGTLRLVDRCRCGDSFCATCTGASAEGAVSTGQHHHPS